MPGPSVWERAVHVATTPNGEKLFVNVYNRNEEYFSAARANFLNKQGLRGIGIASHEIDAILHEAFPNNWLDPTDPIHTHSPVYNQNFIICPFLIMHEGEDEINDSIFLYNIYNVLRNRTVNPPASIQIPFGYSGGHVPHAMLMTINIDPNGETKLVLTNSFGQNSAYNECLNRIVPMLGQAFNNYDEFRKQHPGRPALSFGGVTMADAVTQHDGKSCGLQVLYNVVKNAGKSGVDMTAANAIIPEAAFAAAITPGENADNALIAIQTNLRTAAANTAAVADNALLEDMVKSLEIQSIATSDDLIDSNQFDPKQIEILNSLNDKNILDSFISQHAQHNKILVEQPVEAQKTTTTPPTSGPVAPAPVATTIPVPPAQPSVNENIALTAIKVQNYINLAMQDIQLQTLNVSKAGNDDKWELKAANVDQGHMTFDAANQALRMVLTATADTKNPAKLLAATLASGSAAINPPQPIYLSFDANRDAAKTVEFARDLIAALREKRVPDTEIILDCANPALKQQIEVAKNQIFGKPTLGVPEKPEALEVTASPQPKI